MQKANIAEGQGEDETGTEYFGEDEIFFGSVPVYLRPVPGEAILYQGPSLYAPDPIRNSSGAPIRTLARKNPIPHPDGGAPVVVPCMPCLDQVKVEDSSKSAGDTAGIVTGDGAVGAAKTSTKTEADTDSALSSTVSRAAAATVAVSLPEELKRPLVKVPDPFEGAPKAFASGCRSACVKVGNQVRRRL